MRIRKNRPEIRFSATCLVGIFLGVPLGCAADDQFSAETSDEYTEPLRDALIGTPSGTIAIPLSGPAVESLSLGKGGATGAGGSASTAPGGPGNIEPVAGSGGSVPDDGSSPGFGSWHFDDCSPKSHFLRDSSGLNANAQQALQASCVPGINGLGVQFRSAKDIVQVPDEPQFSVGQHVGVAAWVNPKTVSGDQPIVIKRLNNQTAFSLGVHNGNIEMSVVLSTGKTVISRAPIAANKWTHVAGMYDGTFVFLFINGQQFGQIFAAGSVRDVFAPIRIGATTGSQFFNGTIDEVFLTTDVINSSTLTNLSCITRPSTFSVSPATSGPVPAETNVHYDIAVMNNDIGGCPAKEYDLFNFQSDPGISANADFPFQQALPGAQLDFGVEVSSTDSADPGVHAVTFFLDSFGGSNNNFEQLTGQLTYELSAPTGCFVTTRKELMITNPSVVDDPIRAAGSVDPSGGFGDAGGVAGSGDIGEAGAFAESVGVGEAPKPVPSPGGAGGSGGGVTGPAAAQTAGVWSFGYLMRQMAPTPEAAPALTLQLLKHWLTDQIVNGFTVAARPAMQRQLIDIWPKTANGELDLDRSPLTLQAIVNRIDTRNLAEGSAGEGRFVFGVNGDFNFQNFSLIVEYNLVAQTDQDVSDWANRWHALGSLPFPSEEYNAALEGVTRRFTDRNASPDSANGSALVELRSNEIALSPRREWELRSFVLSKVTGLFDETTVKETPDLSFNGTSAFARFVNQNADAIIAEVPGANSHTVPLQFEGSPFMGGSVINNQAPWSAPGINNPDARFHASMNTCNGCHSPETGTLGFLMVTPRSPGGEALLSPFLTGTTVFNPLTRQTRTLNDLARRKTDLTALVCPTAPLAIAKQ